MENQTPVKDGKQPLIKPEPKTLSKEQCKQAQVTEAEMHSPIFQRKLDRGTSKEEASSSATKPDEAAGTQPKVPFPWPA